MEIIAKNKLPDLRTKVRFLAVPIVSVYGVSEKTEADSIVKRYDIPQIFLGINSNRDCYECRLTETRNILTFAEKTKILLILVSIFILQLPKIGVIILPYILTIYHTVRR